MAESGFIHNYHRGHNPLLQTKRGKVQQRRGALNEQISKQIRLRNGAENLLRVTQDKKIRDQIVLELSFLDSSLQLLKEELSELNADVQIYQNDKCSSSSKMPQLALGLKETKDVEFTVSFNDILTEHYFVDASKYDEKIRQFSEMRKSIRTPPRNDDGIKLLIQYYNQLCYIEKRFYSYSRPLSTYFEWFDAVTGIPAIQRSVAFEKGSILFNIGALFTQLGANEDRNDAAGLQKCMDYYSRAVGYFQYLKENFSHSPSNDMQSDTLMALIYLFLAQIQECIWEIYCDQLSSLESFQESFILAQESSQVSKMYDDTYQAICLIPYKPYLPSAWSTFTNLKKDFYSSMAHYFTAVGILALKENNEDVKKTYRAHFTKSLQYKPFSELHASLQKSWHPTDVDKPPPTPAARHLCAQIHLKHAYQLIDECSTNLRLNKSLRKMTGLSECLKKYANLVTNKQKEANLMESEDCAELYEAESVIAHTTFPAIVIAPDFTKFAVEDLFKNLGPLSVFNARSDLCPARTVQLTRTVLCPGFGFSVKGDMPVSISSVELNGLAAMCNVSPGDFIVAVGDVDCKFSSHDEVVRLIRTAGDCLTMTVVSPKRRSLTENSVHSFNSSSLSSANSHKSNNSSATNSVTHENDSGVGSCDGKNSTTKSGGGGWFSSTLPSSFKSKKLSSKEKDLPVVGGSVKEKNLTKTKSHVHHHNQNGGQIYTYSNIKDLKDKKAARTASPSSSSTGSPWRVRSFLSLKKTKSDSKLSGASFTSNSNNDEFSRKM